ncbi:MAG: hypothetical protein RTV31_09885 [Candidatus Thorarchaeota archaeon]
MSEVQGIEDIADKIVFGLNIGYGAFLVMLAAFGLLIDIVPAIIGMTLGAILMLIAWMFLKPVKKEGWLYAFIMNIVTIPAGYFLLPFPIEVFPITFAVLIIIIMILPPMRKPYT